MKSIDAQSCRALKSRGSRTSRRIVIRTSTNGLPNQEAIPRILFCAQRNTPIFICDSPDYHSGLEWILGVAFEDTLTRPARLAQGFTHVRCCGSPRASSPHGLAAPALASHDGRDCVQLPPARGCYHLAPRRTFTSNPVPMPGTPSAPASGGFGLDKAPLTDISR